MVIQKKELLEILKASMPGVENGSAVLEGSDTFAFHDGKVFTYNDSISVMIPIKNDSLLEEKLEGCVKAEEFFKVVNKLPADEIKFTVTDKNTWLLKCGKARLEMSLLDFNFEARLKNVEPDENLWVEINDSLLDGVSCCRMSSNKSQLAGVYFEGDEIISTDGNQMNCYKLKDFKLPKFWISDNSVAELLKLKKLIAMQVNKTWCHFKAEDGTIFSIKTLQADKYPADKLLNILNSTNIEKSILHSKFPKGMFEAIDRAVAFSIEISEHLAVRLSISKEKIEISAERSSGKYNEKVSWDEEIKTDFEPLDIYVDANMISFISQRTPEFYLIAGPMVNGKCLPRLLFVTEVSRHLICTLNGSKE